MSDADASYTQAWMYLVTSEQILDTLEKDGPEAIKRLITGALKGLFHDDAMVAWMAQGPIADATSKLRDMIAFGRKTLAPIRKGLTTKGATEVLRDAADQITTKIVNPTKDLAFTVSLGKLDSTLSSNWDDGDASEAYRNKVDDRDDAVREIGTMAAPIAEALGDIANQIELYYLGIASALASSATALGGIVGSMVSSETGWGAIIGLFIAMVGALSAFISLLISNTQLDQAMSSVTANLLTHIPKWPEVLK